MLLDEALSSLGVKKCRRFNMEKTSTFEVVDDEDFYYPSRVSSLPGGCDDSECKFILFSAPGAVGKTAMARHIAKNYGGFYWNVAKTRVTQAVFAGELAHAVGLTEGSRYTQFIHDMNNGEALVVLDAFDEAALISGYDGVRDFLLEIGRDVLKNSASPSVILMARTGTAEFITKLCSEFSIGVKEYSIDYFDEDDAPKFIEEYLISRGIRTNAAQKNYVEKYLDEIKNKIRNNNSDVRTFIGYAQVLMILSRRFETLFMENKLPKNVSLPTSTNDNGTLIYDIIQELLRREEGKLENFRESIREKYSELGREHVVDDLYTVKEQLIRLQYFTLLEGNIALNDYKPCELLMPEEQSRYDELLHEWLPQHVFLRDRKIMPVFRDYLFAEALLDSELSMFADEYQSEQPDHVWLPSRVFMDCYLCLNKERVHDTHIHFLKMAYFSQVVSGGQAFCEIEPEDDDNPDAELQLIFTDKDEPKFSVKIIKEEALRLTSLEHINVSVSGEVILTSLRPFIVRHASIECDNLFFDAPEVVFETYGTNEENSIIVHNSIKGRPETKITVRGKLKVDFPDGELEHMKHRFYELARNRYSFDGSEDEAEDDIEQFKYGLKKVLERFKKDKYNGDPAKKRELIDARCHTGVNGRVLAFLKENEIIYEAENYLYKVSQARLNKMGISRAAYKQSDCGQIQPAYMKYKEWLKQNTL